ncbi:MAG: hypothetical protein FWF54_04075 [Candidatus Azobacteroides sp.]|nr:hypothetical protein [Candidatus Azobacteroides sp.]
MDDTDFGNLKLVGTRQVIDTEHSRAIIQPSFPIYMMKKDDKELCFVAVTKGVQFEGSAFRRGITYFLKDDPKLCEYIRHEKWGFKNRPLRKIVVSFQDVLQRYRKIDGDVKSMLS